jgi:hypothetical protein
MNNQLRPIREGLSDQSIEASLIDAYEASDLIGEIMIADVPVMGQNPRYRNMLAHAELRFSQAVATLSGVPELRDFSRAIHKGRCGCTYDNQADSCDWFIVGQASSQQSRLLLHAAELKLNNFTAQDIGDYPEVFNKWIDYLEASKEDRPKLQAELEQLIAKTTE